jgi:large subunit ribosomal protein L18
MAYHYRLTSEQRRAYRTRAKVKATGRMRLSIHRSGKHIYAQLINDAEGNTVASASTIDKEFKGKLKTGATVEAAQKVGALVAKRAIEKGVKEVVFDRGAYLYHGRVKALADAAREAGLAF